MDAIPKTRYTRFGDENIGSRVCSKAGEGQVLVSGSIPPLVAGSGFEFADRGTHQLKGVPGECSCTK